MAADRLISSQGVSSQLVVVGTDGRDQPGSVACRSPDSAHLRASAQSFRCFIDDRGSSKGRRVVPCNLPIITCESVLRARRVPRSLRMRSAPVIAFSPIGGRPPDFVTGSFVTTRRGRHRWTRPTRISSVPQSGQCSSSCKCSVLPVLRRTTAASSKGSAQEVSLTLHLHQVG